MSNAIKDSKIQEVSDKEIDFEIPSFSRFNGSHTNLVPMYSNTQTARMFYGSRFANQAMPLEHREAPLVQALDPEDPDGKSFEDKYGERMGARYFKSDKGGEVVDVTPDNIRIKTDDGKETTVDLYNNFQFNRKTYLHNKPVVQKGDKVAPGQLLASSNFTDDNGTMSMGRNARTALVAYKGFSMDDAVVVSESFAQKMTSQHNYEHDVAKDDDTKFGKTHFSSLFPRKFTKEQLDMLDDNGVVKPGTVLHKGDPIILATRPKPVYSNAEHLGKLGKTFRSIRSDASEVWEHDYPGTVTDVANGKKGYKAFVTALAPLQVGDKLITSRVGNKGIVSKIIPDNQILRSMDGRPFEVLLNPLSLPSRVNTATIYELALGKIAKKNGKPYKVPAFTEAGVSRRDMVLKELEKNGVDPTEEVYDPVLGRKLAQPVTTGYGYTYKLHHVVESKKSARGQGSYDQNFQPLKGGSDAAQSKRIGGLETTALMAKGGYNVLREGSTIRGTRNDDYWRLVREGYKPAEPGTPFVFQKYLALLNGAGVNAKDLGKGTLRLEPMTDRTLEDRQPMEIKNGKTVKSDTLDPEEGGLFDPTMVALGKWGKIPLSTHLPNPAMEGSICTVLGIKEKDMRAVLAGKMTLKEAREQGKGGHVKKASSTDKERLAKLLSVIVNEYKKEGYDLSHMKAEFSDTPRYTDGREVPAEEMDPDAFGGSWTNTGTVYINPNREGPMTFYGQNGTKDPEEFSRAIMAHELAHEIYKNHATDEDKEKVRKAIAAEGFTTDYLANGVAPHKMDEEGFAEYMARKVMNRMSDKDKLEAALDNLSDR